MDISLAAVVVVVDERTVVALPEKSLPPRVASMREVGLVVVERSVGLKMLVETPEVIDQEDLNSQLYVPFFSITPLIENRATTFIIYIYLLGFFKWTTVAF